MGKAEGSTIIARADVPADAPADTATQRLSEAKPSGLGRFATRVQRRYASQLSLLGVQELQRAALGGDDTPAVWQAAFDALIAQNLEPPAALRVMRQLCIAALSEHDHPGGLNLAQVTACMTGLAEFALRTALGAVTAQLAKTHGLPMHAGQVVDLWVVGMGKLGGRELNVSSDIDLVYLYAHDGETAGDGHGGAADSISNQEFFIKAARGLQTWIADVTEHGFVFRLDLALRPHGNSGPVVTSLNGLRDYLLSQGREWERFAWMKSRVITPSLSDQQAKPLRDLVTPFVYRRYLDYPVFDALRDLHKQIREHSAKRALGRPQRAHDVKLGRGGIREIEFLVQSQQIVRGGQFPELRTRSSLKGLQCLAHAHLIDASLSQQLAEAYTLLRNLEHRIQYQDDAQTHELPSNDADLEWVAQHMGFASPCELLCKLDEHRERVASAFDAVLGAAPAAGKCKGCNCDETVTTQPQAGTFDSKELASSHPELALRLHDLAKLPRFSQLKPADLARLTSLVQRCLTQLQEGQCSATAALRYVGWLEGLLKREGYFALLVERPQVQLRVLKLLGSSRWAMNYLVRYPSVVDELASEHWLQGRFNTQVFVGELIARRDALARGGEGGEGDEETLMNLMRRAQHAQVFRTLARDVEGLLTVEQVADDLSALADCLIATSLQWIWQAWWQSKSPRAHQARAELAVLAYGKLGGKELGYGSDLDLVFIHNDDHERAQECYAALAKRLINWFTTKTAQGDLYEIDTALRPNGNAGMLVTHIASFEQYQTQRGGNAAWTWEHQALTRVRVVCGETALAQRIEATRAYVLQTPRDLPALRAEIVLMRQRMQKAHPAAPGTFNLKHSPGGMIDVEFAVQCLVLAHAKDDATLLANCGNIALLEHADAANWLPQGIGSAAAAAYRQFRAQQHSLRLDEKPLVEPVTQWQTQREAVFALWKALELTQA